jgi:hypothetical protein
MKRQVASVLRPTASRFPTRQRDGEMVLLVAHGRRGRTSSVTFQTINSTKRLGGLSIEQVRPSRVLFYQKKMSKSRYLVSRPFVINVVFLWASSSCPDCHFFFAGAREASLGHLGKRSQNQYPQELDPLWALATTSLFCTSLAARIPSKGGGRWGLSQLSRARTSRCQNMQMEHKTNETSRRRRPSSFQIPKWNNMPTYLTFAPFNLFRAFGFLAQIDL